MWCCAFRTNAWPRSLAASARPTCRCTEVAGTRGSVRLDAAYEYADALKQIVTIDGATTVARIRQTRSVRARARVLLELHPLRRSEPEPSGWEGLADVRVILRGVRVGGHRPARRLCRRSSASSDRRWPRRSSKPPVEEPPELVHPRRLRGIRWRDGHGVPAPGLRCATRCSRCSKIADLDISAASGLVALADRLCAVADDELFLATTTSPASRWRACRCSQASCPRRTPSARRRSRIWKRSRRCRTGGLLAFGSGSTPMRMRGALIDPAQRGERARVDLAPLYTALPRDLPDLNIEGADRARRSAVARTARQRCAAGVNACIELDLRTALAEIDARRPELARALRARASRRRSARSTACRSASPTSPRIRAPDCCSARRPRAVGARYEDGVCAGSVVGVLSTRGEVRVRRAEHVCKLEGLAAATKRRRTRSRSSWSPTRTTRAARAAVPRAARCRLRRVRGYVPESTQEERHGGQRLQSHRFGRHE